MRICNLACLQGGAGQGGGVVRNCLLLLHGTQIQPPHYKDRIVNLEETDGDPVNEVDAERSDGKPHRSNRFSNFFVIGGFRNFHLAFDMQILI